MKKILLNINSDETSIFEGGKEKKKRKRKIMYDVYVSDCFHDVHVRPKHFKMNSLK